MNKWEVYLADVPFEDLPQSKIRPVLIIDNTAVLICCLKMTGHDPRPGEYLLSDWQKAGLHKPTTVRLTKKLELPSEKFIKRLGKLSIFDIENIEKMME